MPVGTSHVHLIMPACGMRRRSLRKTDHFTHWKRGDALGLYYVFDLELSAGQHKTDPADA